MFERQHAGADALKGQAGGEQSRARQMGPKRVEARDRCRVGGAGFDASLDIEDERIAIRDLDGRGGPPDPTRAEKLDKHGLAIQLLAGVDIQIAEEARVPGGDEARSPDGPCGPAFGRYSRARKILALMPSIACVQVRR